VDDEGVTLKQTKNSDEKIESIGGLYGF